MIILSFSDNRKLQQFNWGEGYNLQPQLNINPEIRKKYDWLTSIGLMPNLSSTFDFSNLYLLNLPKPDYSTGTSASETKTPNEVPLLSINDKLQILDQGMSNPNVALDLLKKNENLTQEQINEAFDEAQSNELKAAIVEHEKDLKLKNTKAFVDESLSLIKNGANLIGGGSGTLNTQGTAVMDLFGNMVEQDPGLVGSVAKGVNTVSAIANNTYNKVDEYLDLGFLTQISGSSPLGLFGINNWNSKKFSNYTVDPNLRAKLGQAYTGSFKKLDYAADNIAGKRIATGDVSKMKKRLNIAMLMDLDAHKVLDKANEILARGSEMTAINNNRRSFELNGNYDLSGVYAAKKGIKLPEVVYSEYEPKETPDWFDLLSDYEVLSVPNITISDPINIADFFNKHSNVPFVKRILDPNRKVIPNWSDENEVANFKLSYGIKKNDKDEDLYYIYPEIQEIDGELHDFTDPKYKHDEFDAVKSAIKNKDFIYVDSKNEAEYITKHYKEYFPGFEITKYAKGGSVNVIPEGALHARNHHMDVEGITKKGIPVISESEDGKIQQLAEIEHSEIIFRKEVTELLEDLLKDFDKSEIQKDKDNIAIEAGKLLVQEILYNTDDRTNLINQM